MEEVFVPIEKPTTVLTGAAVTETRGRRILDLVEVSVSQHRYKFVVSIPQAQSLVGRAHCNLMPDGRVIVEGQLPLGELLVEPPPIVPGRKVVQQCPTEPWCISFRLPGPLDLTERSFRFRSTTEVEVMVKKQEGEAGGEGNAP